MFLLYSLLSSHSPQIHTHFLTIQLGIILKNLTEFNLCSWMYALSFEHGQPTWGYTLKRLVLPFPEAINCQKGWDFVPTSPPGAWTFV